MASCRALRDLSLAKFSTQVVNSSEHLALYFLIQCMMELANGLAAHGKMRSLCFLVLCETGAPLHVEKVGLLTGLRSLSVSLLELLTGV